MPGLSTALPTAPARRGRAFAAVLAALAFSAASAGCAKDDDSAARVTLLPRTEATGGEWDWTAACRVGPRSATGCATAAPVVGTAQLTGNAWNLGGRPDTSGAVRMSVGTSGGLVVNGNLSDAPPCTDPTCVAPEANTWVRGYPSVLYGIDQCNATTSPPQSSGLQLPMRVDAIPSDLIGTTTYEAIASKITYTVAYDMWLNPSSTKTPCRTNGTLEVMVWTDYDDEARLPDSMRTANTSIPYAVNGAAKSGDKAWSVYVSNVSPNGETAPWGGTIWFVLDPAQRVERGTISVDLSVALAAVGGLVHDVFGWKDFASNYWLDTITFGMEFGPDNAATYGAGRTDFALNLSAYCLEAGTKASAARC